MDDKSGLKQGDVNSVGGRRFSELGGFERVIFVGKVVIFVFTFGFAFPNVFIE